jgi:hypothetical protein
LVALTIWYIHEFTDVRVLTTTLSPQFIEYINNNINDYSSTIMFDVSFVGSAESSCLYSKITTTSSGFKGRRSSSTDLGYLKAQPRGYANGTCVIRWQCDGCALLSTTPYVTITLPDTSAVSILMDLKLPHFRRGQQYSVADRIVPTPYLQSRINGGTESPAVITMSLSTTMYTEHSSDVKDVRNPRGLSAQVISRTPGTVSDYSTYVAPGNGVAFTLQFSNSLPFLISVRLLFAQPLT